MSEFVDTDIYYKVATLDEGIPSDVAVVNTWELAKWFKQCQDDAVMAHYNYPIVVGHATPSDRKEYESCMAYERDYSLNHSELSRLYDVINKMNED